MARRKRSRERWAYGLPFSFLVRVRIDTVLPAIGLNISKTFPLFIDNSTSYDFQSSIRAIWQK